MLGVWSMISSKNSDVAMWDASWHLKQSQACQNVLYFHSFSLMKGKNGGRILNRRGIDIGMLFLVKCLMQRKTKI